jgi:hypothetical protein
LPPEPRLEPLPAPLDFLPAPLSHAPALVRLQTGCMKDCRSPSGRQRFPASVAVSDRRLGLGLVAHLVSRFGCLWERRWRRREAAPMRSLPNCRWPACGFRVPAVYLSSAFLSFLHHSAERKMNKLRRIKPGGHPESRRPRHSFQKLARMAKSIRCIFIVHWTSPESASFTAFRTSGRTVSGLI